MPYLKHESGEATELRNRQVLGDASPLEFDNDGFAHVDDPRTAEMLLSMHRHVEQGGHGPDTSADEFDAETFVDRTPMDDVVEDIESGEFDAHLDAIGDAAEREGVLDAVAARSE